MDAERKQRLAEDLDDTDALRARFRDDVRAGLYPLPDWVQQEIQTWDLSQFTATALYLAAKRVDTLYGSGVRDAFCQLLAGVIPASRAFDRLKMLQEATRNLVPDETMDRMRALSAPRRRKARTFLGLKREPWRKR